MTAPDWVILSLVSALTGITASMGLGGGFILVIYLTVFEKTAQLEAQGINLLFFLPIAAFSLIFHAKNHLIEKKVLLPSILPEIAGVFLGVFLARTIGSDLLRKIFAGFVLLVGIREIFSAFRKKSKTPEKDEAPTAPDNRQNTDPQKPAG